MASESNTNGLSLTLPCWLDVLGWWRPASPAKAKLFLAGSRAPWKKVSSMAVVYEAGSADEVGRSITTGRDAMEGEGATRDEEGRGATNTMWGVYTNEMG